MKCVDDTVIYDNSIEKAFYHTWDYLYLCASNSIVIDNQKFQLCKKTFTITGLNITPSRITPSNNNFSAIADFPLSQDITGAQSWFGLVNQVAWAHSVSEITQPFRELIKPNNKFLWTAGLDRLCNDTKVLIISKLEQEKQTVDTKRQTSIQYGWSKDGIGYVVFSAPTCCSNGWQLTFTGSRFTTSTEN